MEVEMPSVVALDNLRFVQVVLQWTEATSMAALGAVPLHKEEVF